MRGLHIVMRFLIGAVALIMGSTPWAQNNTKYVRISEYLQSYPQQTAIMDQFAQVVREAPRPLDRRQISPTKIAIIYPGIQASDYWRRSLKSFEQRLQALEIEYRLNTYLSRPSIDTELQGEQLTEALAWKPDYLIFTLDSLHQRSMIERILLKGKPKLILQNITTPIRTWQNNRPFLYTGFDHALGTQLIADRMRELGQPLSPYALLYFSQGYVSQMRGDTFASEMAGKSNLNQIASFYTDGNRGRARAATEKVLAEHPDLKMIFASSTDIALGAINALEKADKLADITINGWGGGEAELKALRAGKLDLTVMRMTDDASVAMAEAIKLDLQSQPERVPHIYSGDIIVLDQQTSLEQIERYKRRAFRYSSN